MGVPAIEQQPVINTEYERSRAADYLLQAATGIDEYVQKTGIYNRLPASHLGLHEIYVADQIEEGGRIVLGFVQKVGEERQPVSGRHILSSREFGFYFKGADGLLRKIDDPKELAMFLDERGYYPEVIERFDEMQQLAGILPDSFPAWQFNESETNDGILGKSARHEGSDEIQTFAFVRSRDPGRRLVRIAFNGITAPEGENDLLELLRMPEFRQEVERYNSYGKMHEFNPNDRNSPYGRRITRKPHHSPRLVGIHIVKLQRTSDGTIDIPSSTIRFVWKPPLDARDHDQTYSSILGLERSEEQRTAKVFFSLLGRKQHFSRNAERTEIGINGLVVRIESGKVQLLTAEGKRLRGAVSLAAYMKRRGIDPINFYSEAFGFLMAGGFSFPQELLKYDLQGMSV